MSKPQPDISWLNKLLRCQIIFEKKTTIVKYNGYKDNSFCEFNILTK